jgi:osmotically-inducible protein OsmY
MRQVQFLGLSALIVLNTLCGCGGAKPYTLMAKAAQSEETPMAQARDHRLQLKLRSALMEHDLLKSLSISPYVFQDRAFLVGAVKSEAERDTTLALARDMAEFRSVDGYLPVVPEKEESSFTSDATRTAEIKARLLADPLIVASRVDVKTIDGHVVLVGVVTPREKEAVLKLVGSLEGTTGITDFLQLPDPEYERIRPGIR